MFKEPKPEFNTDFIPNTKPKTKPKTKQEIKNNLNLLNILNIYIIRATPLV